MAAPLELDRIRALTFDVGGTVFDWHSTIRDEVARLARERGADVDAARFANEWRRGMFEALGPVARHEAPWKNADQLHRDVLDDLARSYPQLSLSDADRDALNAATWHRLRAWPDAAPAIERLRSRYTVVVLTVLSFSIAVDCSKHNGIAWDGIVSCEFLGHYKPQPEAYRAGLRLLGTEPAEAMMVAAHPGDLRAAAATGMRTGYIPRPGERGEGWQPEPVASDAFDVVSDGFADFAGRLGV